MGGFAEQTISIYGAYADHLCGCRAGPNVFVAVSNIASGVNFVQSNSCPNLAEISVRSNHRTSQIRSNQEAGNHFFRRHQMRSEGCSRVRGGDFFGSVAPGRASGVVEDHGKTFQSTASIFHRHVTAGTHRAGRNGPIQNPISSGITAPFVLDARVVKEHALITRLGDHAAHVERLNIPRGEREVPIRFRASLEIEFRSGFASHLSFVDIGNVLRTRTSAIGINHGQERGDNARVHNMGEPDIVRLRSDSR